MTFTLTSPTIADGEPIPDRHARLGEDLSPALIWTDPPEGTVGYLLVVDDPDAPRGPFNHWILSAIPGDAAGLSEGLPPSPRCGVNDFGDRGYGGPQPPVGDPPHRYRFRLVALDRPLDLPEPFDAEDAWAAARDHSLGEAVLTGLYRRA